MLKLNFYESPVKYQVSNYMYVQNVVLNNINLEKLQIPDEIGTHVTFCDLARCSRSIYSEQG